MKWSGERISGPGETVCIEVVWTGGEYGRGTDGEEECGFRCILCEVESTVTEGLNGRYKRRIK